MSLRLLPIDNMATKGRHGLVPGLTLSAWPERALSRTKSDISHGVGAMCRVTNTYWTISDQG